MAFSESGLSRVTTSYNRQADDIFNYSSDDTIDTISADGYFDSIVFLLRVGTYIIVNAESNTTILIVTSATRPVQTESFTVTTEIPNFTSGLERVVGFDPTYGTLYEVRNFNVGVVPNNATVQSIFQSPTDIDFLKPIDIQTVFQNPIDALNYIPQLGNVGAFEVDINLKESAGNAVFTIESNFAGGQQVWANVLYYKV